VLELEVQPMASVFLLDADTLGLGIVLHYQLFKVQKCTLVVYFLTHLHLGLPVMWRVSFFAIVALIVFDDEFYDNRLLNGSTRIDLFLHSDLDFKPLRMRLSPQEGSINELNSLEPFDLLQTKGE
jgi:hypothetical protein